MTVEEVLNCMFQNWYQVFVQLHHIPSFSFLEEISKNIVPEPNYSSSWGFYRVFTRRWYMCFRTSFSKAPKTRQIWWRRRRVVWWRGTTIDINLFWLCFMIATTNTKDFSWIRSKYSNCNSKFGGRNLSKVELEFSKGSLFSKIYNSSYNT